jgi:hypothetical protein
MLSQQLVLMLRGQHRTAWWRRNEEMGRSSSSKSSNKSKGKSKNKKKKEREAASSPPSCPSSDASHATRRDKVVQYQGHVCVYVYIERERRMCICGGKGKRETHKKTK